MPLNYSKWDNLELSDDSDVEVHPNVDKRSFIRWKQRDIHEKRDLRKHELESLKLELSINEKLVPMLNEIVASTSSEGHAFFSRRTAQLTAGRAERGNKDGPDGPTPDDMIISLLLQINEEDGVKGKQSAELDEALVSSLKGHLGKLEERTKQVKEQIAQMEEEDKKKITSDSIREGWSAGYVAKAELEPPQSAPSGSKKKAKNSTQSGIKTIETINSPSTKADAEVNSGESSEDDDDEIPAATSAMLQFASLPSAIPPSIPYTAQSLPGTFIPSRHLNTTAFEKAYVFLGEHRELLRPGTDGGDGSTTDALLVEAFQAEQKEQKDKARKCVEKALLVQYCQKLGKDGVSLFFKKMVAADGKAALVFLNDVLSTYVRIATRCAELAQRESSSDGAAGEEQIQLVAEDPSTTITFEVPDGPPPEHITLEGEGLEGVSIDAVRDHLQRRWDLFCSFPDEFREALKTKELDQVNKALGKMKVDEAERLVGLLDEAGILSFSSTEIRDETGKA
ncbi:hypothetical protein K437DRAFT_258995 [Tilletiaria anomala UBC 951]|uniref:Hsp90 chaperone protein kinase-targeting subunit n=1 Tax=Tilletiaria anomala (strain ATCC 24038 / CBS 436.72 / UBC 951) TaxID=1037660 RepID=A0A066VLH7_TILAU|nr:uncharacterized protein K437DRAFT_258995 [Tilletiaria anomala UBC 951]KDN39624.1 hypothetical protein K437DRAFT_258995 [Tilletiaria anomala UBC 951]